VEALQARGRPGDGVIDERYVGPEFPGIAAGERVRITDGPFADLHGICRWSNQKRISLLLEVMGTFVETEMKRAMVSKDG
jgi:transcription antitermination factor NusG